MDDRKKKLVLSGLAITMVAGATTGAALAYLTDGETAENTFTIGDVSIEGIEPNYPGNDSDDVQDIVPNKEINKDPQIDNDGVNDAIVFMTVDSPMSFVTVVKDDGTIQTPKSMNEIFWFKDSEDPQSTHENNFDENWQELSAKEMYVKVAADGTETKLVDTSQEALKATYDALQPGESLVKRYVFGYKTAIQGSSEHDGTPQTPENKLTSALFDKVQLKNVIENEIDEAVEKIVVKSYAIQASNILENSVDLGTNLNEANLGKIYDIFVRQNSEGNDASGTKLNEVRDVDLLTPTENGASGTTDPHKNRFGTDSDVTSPNNVNPNMPITYNGIYGNWYGETPSGEGSYTFNEDGTYLSYFNGQLEDQGTFEVKDNKITLKSSRDSFEYGFPYSLNSDSTEMNVTMDDMPITFTRIAPAPKVPAKLDDILGDWYVNELPDYAEKLTFSSDYTFKYGNTYGEADSGRFTIDEGTINLTFSDGYEETNNIVVSEDGSKLYLWGYVYTRTPVDADFPEPPELIDLIKYAGEYSFETNCSSGKSLQLSLKFAPAGCTETRIKINEDGSVISTTYYKSKEKLDEFFAENSKFSEESGLLYFDDNVLTKVPDGSFGEVYIESLSDSSDTPIVDTYLFTEGETVGMLPRATGLYRDAARTTLVDTTAEFVNGTTYYSATGDR